MTTKSLIVKDIEYQSDRTLLYGEGNGYFVIASPMVRVKIGDRIVYEPYGWNFGWLVEEKKS